MKPITIPLISALSLLRYRTHSSYIVYSNTAQAIEKKKKKKRRIYHEETVPKSPKTSRICVFQVFFSEYFKI